MAHIADPYDLDRFVRAQSFVIDAVLDELRQGRKRTHWMWFVFPQIAGLGFSERSRRYAIASLDEARAYLGHPVLGERLRTCVSILLGLSGLSAHDIFGSPDDSKLQSSLSLFAEAAPDDPMFRQTLERYFDGKPDQATLARL